MIDSAETLTASITEAVTKTETPLGRFFSDFCENKPAVAAFVIFCALVFIAIFAPHISPQNPYDLGEIDILDSRLPPGAEGMTGMNHVLGTDLMGHVHYGGLGGELINHALQLGDVLIAKSKIG